MTIIKHCCWQEQQYYSWFYFASVIFLINQVGIGQQAKPAVGLKVTKIKVESGQKYRMGGTPLQKQARIYTDRDHLKFTNVPKSVTGLSYLMTANADHKGKGKTFLTFAVSQSVRLWVGRDSRGDPGKKGVAPKWLSSNFQRTNIMIETNEPGMGFFVLYQGKADLAKGKHSLGGNADPPAAGQMNNYVLLFSAGAEAVAKQELSVTVLHKLSLWWGKIKLELTQ